MKFQLLISENLGFSKSGFFQYKKLIYFAIGINRVGLIDSPYCSLNTERRRMDISAIKKNTSCSDDMITPASKRYYISYAQIRYPMKRLSAALDSKLKQGRPPKYCRMCHRELCKLIGRQLEREPLEKKYVKGRNKTEQRCDKRKNFSSAKENRKQENAVLSQVLQQTIHAKNKTE